MLGNRKLIVDAFCEVYDLIKHWVDDSFWDFSQVQPENNAIYMIGRQQLINHIQTVRDMCSSDRYTMIFNNSAEGSWTLESQISQLKLNELASNKQLLLVGGAQVRHDFACLSHEHFLSCILDYEENVLAQSCTEQIFADKVKPYQFLFLNGRARPHRKYLYEKFKRTDVLDQSLWTMLDSKPTVSRAFDFHENAINIMATPSTLQRLPDRYEVERYRQPNFGPIVAGASNIKQELFRLEWGEIYLAVEPYIDTYFSLVTETVCSESDNSFRTEKIAKPLAIGHPFVIAANMGFYRDLRNLGFQTFHGVIDESFDLIANPQERMDRVVQIVTDLCRQDLQSFLDACYGICKYNQQRLVELQESDRRSFPERFFQFVNQNSHG